MTRTAGRRLPLPYVLAYVGIGVVFVIAIGWGLSALRSSPRPEVSGSGAVSASPTLPAPVASPGKPDRWSDTGPEGAKAAAEWFVGPEYRYVLETNDVTEWQRLSDPECVFCSARTTNANSNAANHYVTRQGRETNVVATRVEELNPLSYAVLVQVDQPAVKVLRTTGEQVEVQDRNSGQLLMIMHRVGDDWVLRAAQSFDSGASVPPAVSDS